MGKKLQIASVVIAFLGVFFGAGSLWYAYKADVRASEAEHNAKAAEEREFQTATLNKELAAQNEELKRHLEYDTASLRNYVRYYKLLVEDLNGAIARYRDAEARASKIKNPADKKGTIEAAKRDVLAKANLPIRLKQVWPR